MFLLIHRVPFLLAMGSTWCTSAGRTLFLCVVCALVTLLATYPSICSPLLTLSLRAPGKMSVPLGSIYIRTFVKTSVIPSNRNGLFKELTAFYLHLY